MYEGLCCDERGERLPAMCIVAQSGSVVMSLAFGW